MNESYAVLEEHLANGRLEQAESVAKHILGRDPDDLYAKVGVARVQALSGEVSLAISNLRMLINANPRHPGPLSYLAWATELSGDIEGARAFAHDAARLGGKVAIADTILGFEALEQDRLDDALDYFDRALERRDTEAGAWHGRGLVLWQKGLLADAEDALVAAVQFDEGRVRAWIDLVALEQSAGALEVAADNLALALRAHPGHKELLALKAEEEAIGTKDTFGSTLVTMRDKVYAGDLDGMLMDLDRLISDFSDDPRLCVAKGEVVLATDAGEIPPLVHELTALIREDPMAWEPKCVLGRLLLRASPMQNLVFAVAHAEDAWRLSGEHPHAGMGLVEAWAASGKKAYARALCARIAAGGTVESLLAEEILEGRVA